MNQINIADVQAIIALAINNNKEGVINAMNLNKYYVSVDISDNDLFNRLALIADKNGINELKNILSNVPFDKSKLTEDELNNLDIKFGSIQKNANNKVSGVNLKNVFDTIGDFFSGNTIISTNPNIQTQETLLSPMMIISVAVIAIIAIIIIVKIGFKGAKIISMVIGLIVLSVALYGIFAKKITISGGGASSTIHNGALGWLKGILNGLHVSVAG